MVTYEELGYTEQQIIEKVKRDNMREHCDCGGMCVPGECESADYPGDEWAEL